jgi:CcmD family protein
VLAQQPPAQPTEEFVPVSELPPQEQLPSAPLVVAAYSFVWLALGGYVFSVARRLTSVQRELNRLEADVKRGTRA